jgi:hypothetical protein
MAHRSSELAAGVHERAATHQSLSAGCAAAGSNRSVW